MPKSTPSCPGYVALEHLKNQAAAPEVVANGYGWIGIRALFEAYVCGSNSGID